MRVRAAEAVISVDESGRVLRVARDRESVRGFGAADRPLSSAERAMLVLKMQAVAHAIQNGFWAAQGRLKVLSTTSSLPAAQAYEIVRGFLKSVTGASLPVGAAPAEVIKNVSNALTTLEGGFKSRVIPAIEQVKSGTLHPDRWFAMAAPYVDGIKSILNELDEGSMSALVGKTVDDLVADAKKVGLKAADLGSKLPDYLPFILVGLGGLFLFQMLAPTLLASALARPRLSGYNTRSTHRRKR